MSEHLQPAEKPITESDEFIAQQLEGASIPTLMMSLIHLTGDTSLLRGAIRPKVVMMGGFQGGLSEADQASVRALALAGAQGLPRSRLHAAARSPPPALVQEMMNFMVGERVGDEYVPMMLEELALDGNDSRAPRWIARGAGGDAREVPRAGDRRGHVGPAAGAAPEGSGHPLHGGREERLGRGHLVREPVPGLPRRHRQPLLLVLVRALPVERVLLAPRRAARRTSGTSSSATAWKPTSATTPRSPRRATTRSTAVWDVELKSNTGGAPRKMRVNALVSAVGQLNRPRIPEIAGRETVQGHAGALGASGTRSSTSPASASR